MILPRIRTVMFTRRRFILPSQKIIEMYDSRLIEEEKSDNTVAKYLRDIRAFAKYADGEEITKEKTVEYKRRIIAAGYAARSVNSMPASLNSQFSFFLGWNDLKGNTA